MASSQKKYSTLVSNTLLFAISNFSSKLLSFFIRPYLSYALDTPDIMGVSSLLQQATNLLIPVVSLGVSYAASSSMAALPSAWAFCCCCWPCRWCGSSPTRRNTCRIYTSACWPAACARCVPSLSAPVC